MKDYCMSNHYTIAEDMDVLLAIVEHFGSQTNPCDSIQFDMFYKRLDFINQKDKERWFEERLRTHIIDYIDNNRDIMPIRAGFDTS